MLIPRKLKPEIKLSGSKKFRVAKATMDCRTTRRKGKNNELLNVSNWKSKPRDQIE